MKFEQYRIAEGIKTSISKLGYKKPTDIQYKSIPPILKGEDVLAIAQTGTGKTAAFAIPILHVLQDRKIAGRPDGVKCLIMAPTHELALQIESVFNSLGKHTRINSFCIHGGVDQEPQIKQLNKGVDVLVATPGRMFDLVSQGVLKLGRVEILVLDEADHMLDLGFIKDIRDLMRHLPRKRQTLFFSATINEEIKNLAYSLVINPIRIQISPKDPVAKKIDHAVAYIEMDDKRFFLESIIKDNPEKKMRTMRNFKKGDLKVLIATDVSARGIDIPNVEYVINYDLPETSENYVHRVGRTGRANQKGNAVSFCSSEEKPLLAEVEKNLGKPIKRLEISKKDYQVTLDVSTDKAHDWQALINDAETSEKKYKGAKKSKRKKK
ncbi:MAG: RNA helicase [Bacteroidetes bacterium 4572_114]|nr:MAG: RNA helicase [Bacteroidetes bacterium 4572_114]